MTHLFQLSFKQFGFFLFLFSSSCFFILAFLISKLCTYKLRFKDEEYSGHKSVHITIFLIIKKETYVLIA